MKGLMMFERMGLYELTALRSTLLRGVVSRYATVDEQELWRSQVDAITAELSRRNESPA
jgi:hypothetical protein